MERHDLLALMTKLKLAGMRAAYDDIMRDGVKRRRQDDHRLARPPHPSLRHRRDRQRKLALQEPRRAAPHQPGFVT